MEWRTPKPDKTAEELRAELDWAAQVLTGDASADRIAFALPTPALDGDAGSDFNWDVEVSCRPDQDETAQAAITHVAEKWKLAVPDAAPSGLFPVIEVVLRDDRPCGAANDSFPLNGSLRNGA